MDEYTHAGQRPRSVRLTNVADDNELTIFHASKDMETRLVTSLEVNRPGLQLAGFYDYFDPRRIQVIGIVETTYLSTMPPTERRERLRDLMQRDICALVVCHGCKVFPECAELAEELDVCVFQSPLATSVVVANLISTLHFFLAPRCTRHGVLIEVHGEGLFIMGESGVGKSETALELIKRGHRLIADDAVEIMQAARGRLIGSAPEMIRYYMELRGIGVVDVRRIYGVGAVKDSVNLDLVIKLETWDTGKAYDRLGIESETCEIFDVKLPMVTIPVRPGRNLAVILELAAMNNRQKRMGYNAALELAEQHDRAIDGNEGQLTT